jgi:hypothetical protein
MYSKDEFKRLLSKGITGWEAGLLIFQDNWLSARNEGFLTDKDISAIKASLKSQADAQDYNLLIELHRVADYIDSNAAALISTSCYYLERVAGIGNFHLASVLANFYLSDMPLIVTEKQLKALKSEQKKQQLKQLHCLEEVLIKRAFTEAPDKIRDNYYAEPWEDGENFKKANLSLIQKAEKEIEKLIKAGKLKPVKLNKSAAEVGFEEHPHDSNNDYFDEGITYWGVDESWTPEQAGHYLQTGFSGEQLYKAGLAEWKEEIDTFKTWLLDKKYWITDEAPDSVAIVQENTSCINLNLDSKGHFKLDFLRKWPFQPMWKQEKFRGRLEEGGELAKLATDCLKKLLAERQVLQELGNVIGLDLVEETDLAIKAVVNQSLHRYNYFAADLSNELEIIKKNKTLSEEEQKAIIQQLASPEAAKHASGNALSILDSDLRVPPINLDKLKPAASEVANIRSWIGRHLGGEWWLKPRTKSQPKSIIPESRRKHWMMMAGEASPQEPQQQEKEAGQ